MKNNVGVHRKKMFLIIVLSLITMQFCDKKEEIPIVVLPTLVTAEITNITSSTATSGGIIQDEGNAWVQWSGICWSTSPNPTLDDFKTQDHSGPGPFTSYLTDLNSMTKYYVRAYAINEAGTEYGDQKEFITELKHGDVSTITDERDGKTYGIVGIGDEIWFSENLDFVTPNSLYYNDSASYGLKYGSLYKLEDALTACPPGWHLSTDEEWMKLEIFAGMSVEAANSTFFRGNQGTKLKSTTGWLDDGNGTDNFGFACLPGGYLLSDGSKYDEAGINAILWTSTRGIDDWSGNPGAYARAIYSDWDKILRRVGDKNFGMSVRCVKD